ncbi:nitroreductase [Kitasatospora sp. MAP12-15]|uniref:nitroreductase family protein n=1 Tax=unclassified Kitasatospora TaxID=2633591 RepID=UPI00247684C9|nr:nitroreductase [Kitasatospora sp. MAP12-44]MDH6111413.1 nitroreductase [Kitasatospora sp. MAP12-44]
MSRRPDPVLEAVLTRRSAARLTEPAPGREELEELVRAAATAPDHGRLRPWRLIVVAGDERARLGEVLAEAAGTPEQAHRAAAKPQRAPLLVSVVLCPVPGHPKVPEWEQLAATAAMVSTLALLLHSRGWGAFWRTGAAVESPQVLKYLGIGDGERLLGWLYAGTWVGGHHARPREPFDASRKISWLSSGASTSASR